MRSERSDRCRGRRRISLARSFTRGCAGCARFRVADRRQVCRRLGRNRNRMGRRNVSTVFHVHFWPMIFVAIPTRSGPSSFRWL